MADRFVDNDSKRYWAVAHKYATPYGEQDKETWVRFAGGMWSSLGQVERIADRCPRDMGRSILRRGLSFRSNQRHLVGRFMLVPFMQYRLVRVTFRKVLEETQTFMPNMTLDRLCRAHHQ